VQRVGGQRRQGAHRRDPEANTRSIPRRAVRRPQWSTGGRRATGRDKGQWCDWVTIAARVWAGQTLMLARRIRQPEKSGAPTWLRGGLRRRISQRWSHRSGDENEVMRKEAGGGKARGREEKKSLNTWCRTEEKYRACRTEGGSRRSRSHTVALKEDRGKGKEPGLGQFLAYKNSYT